MSQSAIVSFLSCLWDLQEGKGFERFWLRGPEGDYSLRLGEDLEVIAEEIAARLGDWFYSPHAYLPRGGRSSANLLQLNAIVLDLDDADLEEAGKKLERIGLQPHFVIGTSPDHFQLILLQEPIRLGKRNRAEMLKRQEGVIRTLYELTGGDPSAAKVNQMFRLPGTTRELKDLDGVWDVRIWEESTHPRYSLKQLERAVAKAETEKKRKRSASSSTFRGYRPVGKENERGTDILSCPAIRWLRKHVIAEGYRNTALVALVKAYINAGYSLEEAEPGLLNWVENNTQGPYPKHSNGKPQDVRDPRVVIRAVYNSISPRRQAIDWRILATIRDVDGYTMPEQVAKTITRYLPRVGQVHKPRPVPSDELKHRPLLESLYKTIKTLAELQLQRRGPVWITAEELAQQAQVPLGTLRMRVIPILNQLKIRRVQRKGRSSYARYDLTQAPSTYIPYAIISSKFFKYPWHSVLAYWQRRFKSLWMRFLALIRRLSSLFGHTGRRHVDPSPRRSLAVIPRRHAPRAPPEWSPERVNLSGVWTLVGEVVPSFTLDDREWRRLRREQERLERRMELLREWASLSQEEIERRKQMRLEVARRWALEGQAARGEERGEQSSELKSYNAVAG